jgi:hypothetical protein
MPGKGPTLTIGEPGGLKLGHPAMPASIQREGRRKVEGES